MVPAQPCRGVSGSTPLGPRHHGEGYGACRRLAGARAPVLFMAPKHLSRFHCAANGGASSASAGSFGFNCAVAACARSRSRGAACRPSAARCFEQKPSVGQRRAVCALHAVSSPPARLEHGHGARCPGPGRHRGACLEHWGNVQTSPGWSSCKPLPPFVTPPEAVPGTGAHRARGGL